MYNPENMEPSERLLEQFRQCAVLFQRGRHWMAHEHMREGMVKRSQARLLGILLREDGLPQKDLVEIMDIRPSSVGELVSKLEQSGWAERRENEQDKRVTNVFLTESGRAAAQQAKSEHDQENLFSALSNEEQEQLSALMEKLIDSMKARLERNAPDWQEGPHGRHGFHGPHGPHAGHPGPFSPHGNPGPRGRHGRDFWHGAPPPLPGSSYTNGKL